MSKNLSLSIGNVVVICHILSIKLEIIFLFRIILHRIKHLNSESS